MWGTRGLRDTVDGQRRGWGSSRFWCRPPVSGMGGAGGSGPRERVQCNRKATAL